MNTKDLIALVALVLISACQPSDLLQAAIDNPCTDSKLVGSHSAVTGEKFTATTSCKMVIDYGMGCTETGIFSDDTIGKTTGTGTFKVQSVSAACNDGPNSKTPYTMEMSYEIKGNVIDHEWTGLIETKTIKN